MTHSSDVMSVVLDHDYCAPTIAKESDSPNSREAESVTSTKSSSNGSSDALHVQVVNTSADVPVSSPSPPHSCDSGMDNEFDAILADLGMQKEDFLDIDDLDRLLDSDNDEATTWKADKRETSSSQEGKASSSSEKRNVENTARSSIETDLNEEEKWWLDRSKKNALYARENRRKKKKYVSGLEVEVLELKKENQDLKKEAGEMYQKVSKLEEELTYLKSVLANQSTISLLIKSIAATPGISLSSSLVSRSRGQDPEQKENERSTQQKKYSTRSVRKRVGEVEALNNSKKKKKVEGEGRGGVCLHINQEHVSLELCSQCSIKAQQNGWK